MGEDPQGWWRELTKQSRTVLRLAQADASRRGDVQILPEHLLLGLLRDDTCVAAVLLRRMGASLARLRMGVEAPMTEAAQAPAERPPYVSPKLDRVLRAAADEARRMSNQYVGTEHLLIALLRAGGPLVRGVLTPDGICLRAARRALADLGYKPPKCCPSGLM